jgi:hypothetical protein
MGNLSKARYPAKSSVRGTDMISGRMTCAGASAPVRVTPAVGWTAARTATGQITVTLDQAYKKILYVDASLIGAAANTKSVRPITLTDGGIRAQASVVFELQNTDGTAADQTIDLVFQIVAAQVK